LALVKFLGPKRSGKKWTSLKKGMPTHPLLSGACVTNLFTTVNHCVME
jgi:hypothetical protein